MLPLDGIRVLDLSRFLAGPFCTTILGDLGADIIKVEALPRGDPYRTSPPFHDGESVSFLAVHRNKRSIAMDLRKPETIELLKEFADKVDVVVENFRPGTMEKMGLSYELLSRRNPRLIYAGITGFGRTGPYGELSGVDQIAQGMSGFMSITGLEQAGRVPGAYVLQAGTTTGADGELRANGGRVLNVLGTGGNIEAARSAAYQAAGEIKFRGGWYRSDIAAADRQPKTILPGREVRP